MFRSTLAMNSQPSSNNSELFFIESQEVYFYIKGNNATARYGE